MNLAKKNKPIEAHIVYNNRFKKWVISTGILQGLRNNIEVEILDEESKNQVGKAQITDIKSEFSYLEIIEGKLNQEEYYITSIYDYENTSLKVFFKKTNRELAQLKNYIDDEGHIFNIETTTEYSEANLIINLLKSHYTITYPNDNRPIALPLSVSNNKSIDTLKRFLWNISRWFFLKKITNPTTANSETDIVLELYKAKNEENTDSDV